MMDEVLVLMMVTGLLRGVPQELAQAPFDIEDVARIGVGEAGGRCLWGSQERADEVAEMVMWVLRNQWLSEERPLEYDPYRQFYRASPEAAEQGCVSATHVLTAPQEHDPTGGCQFVISEQDRERLDFPWGDIVEEGVEPFKLHFYRQWPGSGVSSRQEVGAPTLEGGVSSYSALQHQEVGE